MVEDGVGHRVLPSAPATDVLADTALLDEPGALHGPGGGDVLRGARAPDPVQAEVLERGGEEKPYGLGAVSVAPRVGAQGEAEGRGSRLVGSRARRPKPISRPSPLSVTARAYSWRGSKAAEVIERATIASTSSRVRGSKDMCSVARASP